MRDRVYILHVPCVQQCEVMTLTSRTWQVDDLSQVLCLSAKMFISQLILLANRKAVVGNGLGFPLSQEAK